MDEITEQTAKPESTVRSIVRDFDLGGYIYTYSYDYLEFQQAEEGASIAQMHRERTMEPPRTEREREVSQDSTWKPRMIAHLLRRKRPDGSLEPYDPQAAATTIFDAVKRLPMSEYSRLEEVRRDFFGRRRIADVDSIRSFMLGMQLEKERLSLLEASMRLSDSGGSQSTSDVSASTTLTSSTDDSESAESPDMSGSLLEPTH